MSLEFQCTPDIIPCNHDFVQLFAGANPDDFRFTFRRDVFRQIHDIHTGQLWHEQFATNHSSQTGKNKIHALIEGNIDDILSPKNVGFSSFKWIVSRCRYLLESSEMDG